MKIVKWLAILLLLALVGLAASSAFVPQGPRLSDGERVEKLTRDWLQAMVERDWPATYEFTSPGYRSLISESDHIMRMSLRRVQWLGGEVLGHECRTEVCTVDVRVVFKVVSPMRGVREMKSFQIVHQNWINQDGRWWLVPEK